MIRYCLSIAFSVLILLLGSGCNLDDDLLWAWLEWQRSTIIGHHGSGFTHLYDCEEIHSCSAERWTHHPDSIAARFRAPARRRTNAPSVIGTDAVASFRNKASIPLWFRMRFVSETAECESSAFVQPGKWGDNVTLSCRVQDAIVGPYRGVIIVEAATDSSFSSIVDWMYRETAGVYGTVVTNMEGR